MKRRIYEILLIIVLIGLVIGFLFVHKNQNRKNKGITEFEISCDFENQNYKKQFETNNSEYVFTEGDTSQVKSYSGNTSLLVPAWKVYQNIIELESVQASSYITITYKKHNSSSAYFVVQAKNDSDFYHSTNTAVKILEGGWEEGLLKIYTDLNFNDTLKIYIFNSKKEVSYFDDIKISVSQSSYYPEYKGEEPLLVYIEPKQMKKLNKKREQAISKGILQTDDDSWVNAVVYGNGKMMQAKVRLKGDWLDHLKGDKWSFRIKLKNDSWNGMRVFSIQTPFARGFTNEWIIHQTCKDEDILTTRYDFVPVYLNGKPVGIYAYEEHFQKELVESSKRREGPIIKFSETDFWEFFLEETPNDFAYEASVIEPFSSGKILKDPNKYNQFLIAANLLDMYRNLSAKASDIFDVKKMAKFVAFVNSRNAFHALQWHNVRYYYNPVLCRLEPIAFDMFAGPEEFTFDVPISPMVTFNNFYKIKSSVYYLTSDSIFEKEYLNKLEYYTTEKDYKLFREKYDHEYNYRDSLQKLEFYPFEYDTNQFESVLVKIDHWFPAFKDSLQRQTYRDRIESLKDIPLQTKRMLYPDLYGDKYLKCYKNNGTSIQIKSFLQFDVSILGIGNDDQIEFEITQDVINKNSGKVKDQIINLDTEIDQYSQLFFQIHGLDTVFETEIVQWPAPTTYNPRNDIAKNATDISEYIDYEKQEVHFAGDLVFDNHIYTPIGYDVYFESGTTIDLINKSAMIINSTVKMNGTKENPIKVFSSDKTGNGFTVLQAEGKSVVNYVTFDNLNTLDYNWWTLTGAVTFYESDVSFINCKFTNNHCEDMLNTVRCDFYLDNCEIKNTYSDSHDSDFCTGILENCTFTNNGNDAIDFSTSEVTIKSCTINGAGDKGISVGENTKATILNVKISDVYIGIASKDLSHADIDGCNISNATYGFVILQKKPEFGPASITANNCTLSDVWTESLIERNSTLILNGKTYKGKNAKLKALFYE